MAVEDPKGKISLGEEELLCFVLHGSEGQSRGLRWGLRQEGWREGEEAGLARGAGLPAKPQLVTGTLRPRGPSRLVLSCGAGMGTLCPGMDQFWMMPHALGKGCGLEQGGSLQLRQFRKTDS